MIIAHYPLQNLNGIGSRINHSTVLRPVGYETTSTISIMKLLDVLQGCSSGFMSDAVNKMQVNTFFMLANKLVVIYILIFLY